MSNLLDTTETESPLQLRSRWMKLRNAQASGAALRPPIIVSATFTAEPIVPYLAMELLQADRPAAVEIAPYDQIFNLCYSWRETYGEKSPTTVVILWRIEDFLSDALREFSKTNSLTQALQHLDELAAAITALRQTFLGTIIVSTPPYPQTATNNIRAVHSAFEASAFHRRIVEAWIARISDIPSVSLLDLDGIQRDIGLATSVDWRKWYRFRQPFTEVFWREIARDTAALIRGQTTAPKKCVIVDCDNTLWGGVIGEDGLGGIQLGDDFPGSAFRDFQRQLLALKDRGVILAVCSKNNVDDVWEVFDNHDSMLLKKTDVLAFRINWLDKPDNIISICNELNIGLDSVVFVDDNPLEINYVRERLPGVICLQVPADLSAFPSLFGAFRGFDRGEVSEEDRVRTDMMMQERERTALGQTTNAADFRRALELWIEIFEVRAEHVTRAVQLTNKTNQFNMTTKRKTGTDVNAIMADPDQVLLAWKVGDRFGDYGLVGLAHLDFKGDQCLIDNFLMSCRVLGRGVENAVLAAISEVAVARGAKALIGEYNPTPKNAPAQSLYPDFGFENGGDNRWRLSDPTSLKWPEFVKRVVAEPAS